MGQEIVIQAGTADAAECLAGALAPLFVDGVVVDDSHLVVRADRPGDRFVVDLLDALKQWIEASELESVRVLLDGRTYTLSSDEPGVPA